MSAKEEMYMEIFFILLYITTCIQQISLNRRDIARLVQILPCLQFDKPFFTKSRKKELSDGIDRSRKEVNVTVSFQISNDMERKRLHYASSRSFSPSSHIRFLLHSIQQYHIMSNIYSYFFVLVKSTLLYSQIYTPSVQK